MFNYQRVLYKQSNFGGLVLNAYDEFGQTMVNEGKRHRLNFRLTTYWMLDLSTTKLDSNNDRPLGYSLIAKKILIHQEKCGYAKLLGTMVTENRLNLWMFPQKSTKYGAKWYWVLITRGYGYGPLRPLTHPRDGSTPFVLNKIFELAFLSA